jgi:uncharacterized protein YceK
MINHTDPDQDKFALVDHRIPEKTVYGGIAQDVCAATKGLAYAITASNENLETRVEDVGMALLFLLDLPLSIVADTICIPCDIKAAEYGPRTSTNSQPQAANPPSTPSTP